MSEEQRQSAPIEPSEALNKITDAAEQRSDEQNNTTDVQQNDQFSAKFAALSRKEKALRHKEAEVERRLQEMEQKFKEKEQEFEKYRSIPDRLKQNPLEFLKEQGYEFNDLAELALNDGKPTPEMLISEKEKALRQEIAEIKKMLQEKEESEKISKEQQTIDNFKNGITSFIEENNNDYELIAHNDASDLVYEVIEQHYNDTYDELTGEGEILDVKQACDYVEQYFLDEAKRHLELNKIKGMLPKEKASEQQRQSSPTLSNTDAAQVANPGTAHLSNEQSMYEAAKLLKWD